jgi:phage gp37-like protein
MSALIFPAIESGMIARLRAASAENVGGAPLLGYRLRQVEPYAGELAGGPDRLAQAVRTVPAVWIAFETGRYGSDGLWLGTFVAVCATRNARNAAASRQGVGDLEVGVYQVAKDVAGLIDGQTFGVDSTTACRAVDVDLRFDAEFEKTRAAIALVTFHVRWDPDASTGPLGDSVRLAVEPNGADHPMGVFAGFHVDWDIPPFTNPAPATLPAAPPLDAADTITIVTE